MGTVREVIVSIGNRAWAPMRRSRALLRFVDIAVPGLDTATLVIRLRSERRLGPEVSIGHPHYPSLTRRRQRRHATVSACDDIGGSNNLHRLSGRAQAHSPGHRWLAQATANSERGTHARQGDPSWGSSDVACLAAVVQVVPGDLARVLVLGSFEPSDGKAGSSASCQSRFDPLGPAPRLEVRNPANDRNQQVSELPTRLYPWLLEANERTASSADPVHRLEGLADSLTGQPIDGPAEHLAVFATLQPVNELAELMLLLAVKAAGRHVEHADHGQPASRSFLNQRIVLGACVLMSGTGPQPDRTTILIDFSHCSSNPRPFLGRRRCDLDRLHRWRTPATLLEASLM